MDKPLLHRSSSKVTINTKSPTVPFTTGPTTDQRSPAPGTLTEPQHEPEPSHDEDTTSQDPSVSDTTMQMTAPTPISVSSSPPRSPEIEVAEIEDMDQDPSETVWSSAGEDLVVNFPWPCPVQEVSRGLTLARSAIRGTGDGEDLVISGLRGWLHTAAHQNLPALRLSIRAHGNFWDELPWKILEEFLHRKQVSSFPPRRLSTNFGRSSAFGQELEQWLQTTPAFSNLTMFEEMLTDMARLILQLVDIDRTTLEKFPTDTQEVPDLISPLYLGLLEKLLSLREGSSCPPPPLYGMLYRNYGTNWMLLVHNLGNSVCDSPMNGISRLSIFARQILRVNPKPDKDQFTALVRICGIMNNILQSRATIRSDRLAAFQEGYAPPVLMQRTKAIYEFIQLMDPCYQEFIVKLNQNLTAEWNKNILDSISESLFVIAETNPKVMAQIADDYKIDTDDIEASQQAGILKFGWMFHRLHKCITKGRMELRAQAVDIMQDRLVNVFHAHIKGAADPGGHPLVQYLVNFIREVKIIDYIIGVESHTQLMSRSANIIGFLLVTNEYKDEDTDKIWSVIMDSEDSRATTAILQMLDSFFRTSELQPVLYLASKLLDVPIRRFDKDFTDFAHNLLLQITKKYQQEPQLYPDILIYKVCIRLLRDAISTAELVPERKISVQQMARRHLEFLVQWHLKDFDKLDIYGSCVQDIEQKNAHASSALRTLNFLLINRLEHDIGVLSQEFDFARLFVEELAHFVESQASQFSDGSPDGNCFQDRLEILSRIVNSIPNTLDADLGHIVWNTLYASKTLPQMAHDASWTRLIGIVRNHIRGHQRNSFLDRCMNEFLPQLTPSAFDAYVLTFAKESIKYETNLDPPPPPQEGDTVAIPSVERLWNILINVPSSKIAVGASDALVELYLDNKLIMDAPPAAVEATHVAIVDECVKRLTTAAAKLKSFSDGTMSGEDEPMVIIATEEEMKVEELRFSRSLLFLKEFLQGLRKRPRYSTLALQERPNKGEIIDLLYECYDGHIRKPRQNLRIGDLDTLGELKDRLIDVSGFSNLQAFAGAVGKIDFVTNPSQTIRDRKLEKAGLLLVRNAEPNRKSVTPPRRQSLLLVDSEILKHFEELYDLLGLEDRFSKEVMRSSCCNFSSSDK
jgi:ubiquitin carboxyl-terminal hydrolase 34